MKYRDLKKVLKKHGVTHVRTRGDHEVWAVGNCTTSIPADAEVAPGTLRKIEEHLAPCLGEGWLSK
jgi:predicted RNA binding protein YcfA (HicA-like mRNA interferase family)